MSRKPPAAAAAMRCSVSAPGSVSSMSATDTTVPTSINVLGMIRWSRSISVTGTSRSTNAIPSQASLIGALVEHDRDEQRARSPPRRSGSAPRSTLWHVRQRPRSHSHDSTGTLSYGLIGVSQLGQCEAGKATDSPRGSR